MELNRQDEEWGRSQQARNSTRFFVCLLVGIFASWKWLFIIMAFWQIAEVVTFHKIMCGWFKPESFETSEKRAETIGRYTGQFTALRPIGFAVMTAIAAAVKALKDLIF